jgi:hypothetical protein
MKAVEKKKQDKYVVSLVAYSGLATTGFTDLTALIIQGLTVNQRIGQSVRLKHLTIRGSLYYGDPLQVMRIVIFRWRVSSTSDSPDEAELYDTATVAASQCVYGNFLPLKPSRFAILMDKVFTLSAVWQPILPIHIELPLNHVSEYDVGVNTGKDHLYVALVADSGVVPHPTFALNYMLHYHDTE